MTCRLRLQRPMCVLQPASHAAGRSPMPRIPQPERARHAYRSRRTHGDCHSAHSADCNARLHVKQLFVEVGFRVLPRVHSRVLKIEKIGIDVLGAHARQRR